ncbi:hypothetical protein FR943_24720 [Mycobacterium sp. TNTM28]|uniref:DUF1795 domain-containing protein n=1 Tax=[Mycobacterium] fortunisiensis TaxID=2600579 RepID=A0ABS6KTV7_9MYCO|nr:hypothetical protein [[Mycobacterium] fortunisiensis]MBU9767027.1 hypothetical protein [[Mycobacterium] fortunisiensis]
MTRELPFSITFELPHGWELVSPESCDQPDAAYVAVRMANASDAVATNIVISGFGQLERTVDVEAMAIEYIEKLRSLHSVEVMNHHVMTDGPAQEVGQVLRIGYLLDGLPTRLNQIQIISAYPGLGNKNSVAVIQLLMTCPTELFDQAKHEFRQFVGTIGPSR